MGATVSHIILGFSRSDHWISHLVRKLTKGRFSHVMLLNPESRYYVEASGLASPSGVRMHTLPEFFARAEWDFRVIEHPNPKAVWEAAISQVGKPYDWSYMIGWFLNDRDWQDPDKWSCHELILWACEMAGHPIIEMEDAHNLTPHHLYLISKPME